MSARRSKFVAAKGKSAYRQVSSSASSYSEMDMDEYLATIGDAPASPSTLRKQLFGSASSGLQVDPNAKAENEYLRKEIQLLSVQVKSLHESLRALVQQVERMTLSQQQQQPQPQPPPQQQQQQQQQQPVLQNLWTREREQRADLSRSLVIRRLAERVGETPSELRRAVLNVIHFLGGREDTVLGVKRVGTTVGGSMPMADQQWLVSPRLVIVEFTDMDAKMGVKGSSWRLAKSMHASASLDHALTADQQRRRAMQWSLIKEAKAKGWRWCWSDVVPHELIVFRARG